MTQVIIRRTPSQVIEGTPEQIAARLKTLEDDTRLTLIIPGDEIEEEEKLDRIAGEPPHTSTTFRQIFAPSQAGFDQTGITDDELSDFLEAEVKAYRAERRAKEQQGE